MPSPRAPLHGGSTSARLASETPRERERSMPTPEQLARLLELARALSGAVDHADVAAVAADRARVLTGAATAQLAEVVDGDELAPIAESTADAPARPAGPRSIRASEPARDVARTRAAIWIGSRAEARARHRDDPLDAFGGGPERAAWAFLPLVADDALGGVLTLGFDAARTFDPSTRAFLAEIASACASALARGSLFARERERADASETARAAGEARQRRSERLVGDRTRLFERERFARARAEAETVAAVHLVDDLERAQSLTAALAHAETEADVVAALETHGLDGFGAARITVARRAAGGGLELLPLAGVPPSASVPIDAASPEAEVSCTAAALWLDAPERVHRFPAAARDALAGETGSWLGVPLPGVEDARAVLAFAFPYGRAFTMEDRARLALLAEECASALSRCAARDAELAARAPAVPAKSAEPLVAFVVQYEEEGRDRPDARLLGVFSSEAAAREALRELDRRRSLLVRAWITSWALDAPLALTRVEVPLVEA